MQELPPEMRPSRVIRRIVLWGLVFIGVLLAINGDGGAGGGFIAAGIVAWVSFWALGGVVDWLVFAWLGRRRSATAEEQGDAQQVDVPRLAAQIERATAVTSTSTQPSSASDDDDEFELSPANVESDWRDSDAWRSWEPPHDFVAGESHYMPALHALTGDPRPGGYLIPVEVVFIREPTNPYDSNAWRAEVNGRHIGYAARHIAAQLASGLDTHHLTALTVCGVIRGGSLEAPNVGVHVWLDRRPCPGPEIRQIDDAMAVAWPPSPREGVDRPAADMFDDYLRRGRQTMSAGGPEDRVLDALKAAADIAIANDDADQKEAAASLAERLVGYARGTETLARAARLKKRLEPKARSTKQAGVGVEDRLTRLKGLFDTGVISEDEYTAQRAAIIKRL